MKKYISIFVLLIIFPVKAQIAYIDINLILNKSNVGKSLNVYISELNTKNNEKYKKIEDELIQKEQTLISQQNILEKAEFEKKIANLTKQVQIYRSNKKKSIDEIKNIKINNSKKILNILNPIITNYVEENSISIVLPKKNIVVGKKNLDISDKILKLLNNKIQKLDFWW